MKWQHLGIFVFMSMILLVSLTGCNNLTVPIDNQRIPVENTTCTVNSDCPTGYYCDSCAEIAPACPMCDGGKCISRCVPNISNPQEQSAWLNQLIEQERNAPVANPPASIQRCLWNSQVVYVRSARCCDVPFVVYRENGTELLEGCGLYCSQAAQDFLNESKECMVVWSDSRPYPNAAPTASPVTREQLDSLNETQCTIEGYDWVPIPGLCAPNEQGQSGCGNRCDIKTSDGGRECYSNDECEGVCLCSKNEKDQEGFQVGKCSQYKYFTEVIDCPCILETKSTKGNYPFGCA